MIAAVAAKVPAMDEETIDLLLRGSEEQRWEALSLILKSTNTTITDLGKGVNVVAKDVAEIKRYNATQKWVLRGVGGIATIVLGLVLKLAFDILVGNAAIVYGVGQ